MNKLCFFKLFLVKCFMAKIVSNMADDKLKVLKLALDKIEKDYGKGSVMMLGDKQKEKMDVISTGSIGLDVALGRSEEHTSELQSQR